MVAPTSMSVWASVCPNGPVVIPGENERRGAHHAGVVAELRAGDATATREVEGGVPVEGGTSRPEKQVACLREATADGDGIEVEQCRDGGKRDPEGLTCACERSERHRVTCARGLREARTEGVGRGRRPALAERPLHDGGAAGDGFQAALTAARARGTVSVDDDMTDVAGVAGGAVHRQPVEHQTATDTRGDD